jgi:hypothetical protein
VRSMDEPILDSIASSGLTVSLKSAIPWSPQPLSIKDVLANNSLPVLPHQQAARIDIMRAAGLTLRGDAPAFGMGPDQVYEGATKGKVSSHLNRTMTSPFEVYKPYYERIVRG